MIKVIKKINNDTIYIDSAVRLYNLNKFLIKDEFNRRFNLVRFDKMYYKLMQYETNTIICGNYFGELNEVLEQLIDLGYEVYIEDGNKCQ